MIVLFGLIVAFAFGYFEGKRQERANSQRLMDLYFATIEKKEKDFKDRSRRGKSS